MDAADYILAAIVGGIGLFVGFFVGCYAGTHDGKVCEQKAAMQAGVGYWATYDEFKYGAPPAIRAPVAEKEGK